MYKSSFQNLTKFTLRALRTTEQLRTVSRSAHVSTSVEKMEQVTSSPPERLSSSVHPLNYKLVLEPNLETGEKFKGNVVIKINVKEKKNDIYLHANLLEICNVKVFKDDKTTVPVAKFYIIPKVEQLQVHLAEPIDRGIYIMDVDFTGKLSGFLGLYSTYTRPDR